MTVEDGRAQNFARSKKGAPTNKNTAQKELFRAVFFISREIIPSPYRRR